MTRSVWMLFGVILVIVVSAAMMGAATVGEEEERVAAGGTGTVGGEGHGARGAKTGGAMGGDNRGAGCGARLEEGKASGNGGGNDSTFQDLSELSSRSRPTKLRQGTIFEMFEAERGHRRQSGEGTSSPVVEEEEELGSKEDDDDADFDMEAEGPGEEEDKEEQGAEEQPAQVRREAKRRRIHEGVGIIAWSTLHGNGPLEGYRCRPAAMRCFRTIHGVRYILAVSSNVGHIT